MEVVPQRAAFNQNSAVVVSSVHEGSANLQNLRETTANVDADHVANGQETRAAELSVC